MQGISEDITEKKNLLCISVHFLQIICIFFGSVLISEMFSADTLHQSSLTDACYMLSAARCNAALVSGSQHVCSITSSVSHYSVLVYADSNTRLIDLLLPLY